MPIKPAKRRPTKPPTSSAEMAARAERDRLRRLDTLQRNLKAIARNVRRYTHTWEAERVATARALLDGSPYAVFERDLVQRVQLENERQMAINEQLRHDLELANAVATLTRT